MKLNQNEILRLKIVFNVGRELTPSLLYHNFNGHVVDAYNAAMLICANEGVSHYEKYLIQQAVPLHDSSHGLGHESRNSEFAETLLVHLGSTREEAKAVSSLIQVTDRSREPQNKLEMIMLDADTWNLGGPECSEKGELIRQEFGIPKEKWPKMQLDFLQKHRYYTDTAIRLREPGKQENIRKLYELIGGKNVEDMELCKLEQ